MGPRRITEAALGHRTVVLVATAVLLVVAALGVARLHFDFSSRAFYAADPEQARALAALHARWGPDDARMFVVAQVRAGDDDAVNGVVTPERLAVLSALAQRLSAVEGVASARGIADLAGAGGGTVRDLVDGQAAATIVRAVLAKTPAVPLLLAADGKTGAITVELRSSSDDPAAIAAVVGAVEEIAAAAEGQAGLSFSVAGVPVVRVAFFQQAIADQKRLQPIVYVVMAGFLALVFRRWHGVVVPLAGAALPVVMLTGAMGWAGEPIGLLNQVYFTLLPVIAAADAVHWVARYDERLRDAPIVDAAARREAILHTAGTVGYACVFTAATTAAGFLSLATASMPILRAFGVWAALGMAMSFVLTIVVVPVLLSLFTEPPSAARQVGRLPGSLGRFAVARPAVVVGGAVMVAALAGLGASRIVVDNRLGDLLDPSHPARRASALVDRELGGTLSLEVELSGPPGTWDDPAARSALAQLEARIAGAPQTRAVLGPASATEREPSFAAGVLDDQHGVARIRAFVADAGGRAFEAFATHVETMLPNMPGVEIAVTGTTRMAYRGVNRITEDLWSSLAGLLVVVTVTFGVLTRSLRLALVAVPVNALPLLVGVALVGSRGTPLDPIATVVLAVGLGLAVDDTIHLLLRAREHGGRPDDAIAHAVATTGRAASLSALALAGGLAVNLLSSFPPLRALGILGGATILAALAFDLLLLPALVAWVRARQ